VPSVATAVDGVADVVGDGGALLVPPRDPAAAAAAVRDVLRDPAVAASLRAAAVLAARQWTPERMLEGYRRAYELALLERERS